MPPAHTELTKQIDHPLCLCLFVSLTKAFRRLFESNASAMVSGVRGVSGLASTKVAGFMMFPSFSRSSTSKTRLAFGGTIGVMPSAP